MNEIVAVLGLYAAQIGSLTTFRENVPVPSFKGEASGQAVCLTLEDGTDRLSRNVGNKLPMCAT